MTTDSPKRRKSKRINEKIDSLDSLKAKGYLILSDDVVDDESAFDFVSNRIEEVLTIKGLTPPDLVKMTGLSRQSINSVIRGKMKPGIDFVLKVSYVLDTPVEELFFLSENSWIATAKSPDDVTLYVDVIGLNIIDGKTMKELVSKYGEEYHDNKEHTPVTSDTYKKLLSEYIDDSLYITMSEMEGDTNDKKLTERELEALARKKLTTFFNERYIKRYKKLFRKIKPLVNPTKKK